MVVIRLSRTGAKKSPFYHVVVADRRFPRDGRFIERVGYFNPLARGKATRLLLNQERIDHWLNLGAKPSDRARHLIHEFNQGSAATVPTLAEQRMAQSQAAHAQAAQRAKEEAAAAKAAEDAKQAEAAADSADTATKD